MSANKSKGYKRSHIVHDFQESYEDPFIENVLKEAKYILFFRSRVPSSKIDFFTDIREEADLGKFYVVFNDPNRLVEANNLAEKIHRDFLSCKVYERTHKASSKHFTSNSRTNGSVREKKHLTRRQKIAIALASVLTIGAVGGAILKTNNDYQQDQNNKFVESVESGNDFFADVDKHLSFLEGQFLNKYFPSGNSIENFCTVTNDRKSLILKNDLGENVIVSETDLQKMTGMNIEQFIALDQAKIRYDIAKEDIEKENSSDKGDKLNALVDSYETECSEYLATANQSLLEQGNDIITKVKELVSEEVYRPESNIHGMPNQIKITSSKDDDTLISIAGIFPEINKNFSQPTTMTEDEFKEVTGISFADYTKLMELYTGDDVVIPSFSDASQQHEDLMRIYQTVSEAYSQFLTERDQSDDNIR